MTKKSSAQKSQKFIAPQNKNKIGFHRRMLLRYHEIYICQSQKQICAQSHFVCVFSSHLVCWAKKEQVPIKHANWIYRKQMSILVIKQCYKFFFPSTQLLGFVNASPEKRENEKRTRIKFLPNPITFVAYLTIHSLELFSIQFQINKQNNNKKNTQKIHKTKSFLPHKTLRITKLPECKVEDKNEMK